MLLFDWFRRGVRDAFLGGVADAVGLMNQEAKHNLDDDEQAKELLLRPIFPRLLTDRSPKATRKSS